MQKKQMQNLKLKAEQENWTHSWSWKFCLPFSTTKEVGEDEEELKLSIALIVK